MCFSFVRVRAPDPLSCVHCSRRSCCFLGCCWYLHLVTCVAGSESHAMMPLHKLSRSPDKHSDEAKLLEASSRRAASSVLRAEKRMAQEARSPPPDSEDPSDGRAGGERERDVLRGTNLRRSEMLSERNAEELSRRGSSKSLVVVPPTRDAYYLQSCVDAGWVVILVMSVHSRGWRVGSIYTGPLHSRRGSNMWQTRCSVPWNTETLLASQTCPMWRHNE